MRALFIAASGMRSQQINIDVIANNLANVNTSGFKKGRADFEDLFYQTLRAAGASASTNTEVPSGITLGYGSRAASTQKIFSQGDFKPTGEMLDIVIEGDGFFQITLPAGGTAYTRAGHFQQDSTGQIVTPNGDPLTPTITIPADYETILIASDGTVSSISQSGSTTTQIGNIQLANFQNPAGLNAIGSNLFLETSAAGAATTGTPGLNGLGQIRQGILEMSNVSMVDELVSMIIGQRAYEINSKAIQTADEMMQVAGQLK
jgi:flagellar basal-body rod protein FlgG